MRSVHAQFRPRRRPGRRSWIAIAVLAAAVAGLAGTAAWHARHARALGERLAALAAQRRLAAERTPVRPDPPYGDSARLFLRAREAAWAPALRTLESAAMVGVTPVRVEFDAADGTARVQLEYRDADALHDYLSRVDEGLPPSSAVGRWALLEAQAVASPPPGAPGGTAAAGAGAGVATIRASWR